MELNLDVNTLESVADSYHPDRLKALLVWFGSEQQTLETSSDKLHTILNEVEALNIEQTYFLLQSLEAEELVRFSLINEFGSGISKKSYFQNLISYISKRIS